MELIIELVGLSLVSNLFAFQHTTIQSFKHHVNVLVSNMLDKLTKWDYEKQDRIIFSKFKWLSCAQCLGFITGLVYTQNLFHASIVSMLSLMFFYFITNQENK